MRPINPSISKLRDPTLQVIPISLFTILTTLRDAFTCISCPSTIMNISRHTSFACSSSPGVQSRTPPSRSMQQRRRAWRTDRQPSCIHSGHVRDHKPAEAGLPDWRRLNKGCMRSLRNRREESINAELILHVRLHSHPSG